MNLAQLEAGYVIVTGKEIDPETVKLIKKVYKLGKEIGYEEGFDQGHKEAKANVEYETAE